MHDRRGGGRITPTIPVLCYRTARLMPAHESVYAQPFELSDNSGVAGFLPHFPVRDCAENRSRGCRTPRRLPARSRAGFSGEVAGRNRRAESGTCDPAGASLIGLTTLLYLLPTTEHPSLFLAGNRRQRTALAGLRGWRNRIPCARSSVNEAGGVPYAVFFCATSIAFFRMMSSAGFFVAGVGSGAESSSESPMEGSASTTCSSGVTPLS